MKNFPCKCGHKKSVHFTKWRDEGVCMFLGQGTTHHECPCMDYRSDNLKYLEQIYNKSIK